MTRRGARAVKMRSGKRFEDDKRLVDARDDGFRNGDELLLLIEDAEARRARLA